MTRALQIVGQVPSARVEELTAFIADHGTTERIAHSLEPAGLRLGEIIEMDEYTLDLVVPLPDGLCLVYDTT